MITALLHRGADVHARFYPLDPGHYQANAASALHWAASYGFGEVVRLLLNHGANPQHADERGRTPVTCAALSRHFSLIDELVRAGGTLDPLAEIYAELREFPARAQPPRFVQAVQSLTEVFGMAPKQMEGLESVHYWSIQSKEEVVQHLKDHVSSNRFWAEGVVLQAKVDALIARKQMDFLDALYKKWIVMFLAGNGTGKTRIGYLSLVMMSLGIFPGQKDMRMMPPSRFKVLVKDFEHGMNTIAKETLFDPCYLPDGSEIGPMVPASMIKGDRVPPWTNEDKSMKWKNGSVWHFMTRA